MIDGDKNRLEVSTRFGATKVVSSIDGKAAEEVMALTGNKGVDVAIEAVGVPGSFDTCQRIVAAGGHIANIGVHGKPVQLNLDKLWSHNITLTTGLVDTVTTPMLLKTSDLREASAGAAHHASLHLEGRDEGLRYLCRCYQPACAEGNHYERPGCLVMHFRTLFIA